MVDKFAGQTSMISAGVRHMQIAPSDTVEIDPKPRALYCAAAGTALVEDEAGQVLPYTLEAGDILTFRGVRLRVGTTGTWYGWV